jgi:hypothetical protein
MESYVQLFSHIVNSIRQENGLELDQCFEYDRTDFRSCQCNTPIVNGIIYTIETEIDPMVIEDKSNKKHRGECDGCFQK